MVTIVVGLQWGDEGKGKIVDYLAEEYDIIVRFQGGTNAGHTVLVGNEEFIFHLIPSGILRGDKIGAIGAGVVLDIDTLLKEIKLIEEKSSSLENRFIIDGRAHITLPFHKDEDALQETSGKGIGTTKKGIGPTYRDKYWRIGIRLFDLFDEEKLRESIKKSLAFNNYLLKIFGKNKTYTVGEILRTLTNWRDKIGKFVGDVALFLNDEINSGKNVLFEGAQGTFLDITFGTYPYVTSSHTISGGATIGAGLPPSSIRKVVGISKAYTTRVGKGPFPTEIKNKLGDHIREKGGEYGATTGRPRRCGWLDLVLLKYAVMLNGVDEIVITKLDVLDGLDEVKIATQYELADGSRIDYLPFSLDTVKPVYTSFEGWESTKSARRIKELPQNAIKYLDFIEEYLGVKISLVSVGKERNEIIEYH